MSIKILKEWEQTNGKYQCPECNKEYTKMGIGGHIWRMHGDGVKHNPVESQKKNGTYNGGWTWNKGLTKETDLRIAKSVKTLKRNIMNGVVIPHNKGKKLSQKHKDKVSESMKIAHKEGRAHNIGMSRWNNEPSYPEKFFMKVIENEFNDKNYEREYNVGKYSIDFAWVDSKLCIEIDGEQHERFKAIKERDIKKDMCLINDGWKILRIKWKDMYHEPQKWIAIARTFIDHIETSTQIYIYDTLISKQCNLKPMSLKECRIYVKEVEITTKILNSGIDFSSFGWGVEASKIIGCASNKYASWMKRVMPDFYLTCYKRKSPT